MTTDEISNPWLDLPDKAPHVLPADREVLARRPARAKNLRLEVLPDPFIGDPVSAALVLLVLNPGFRQEDIDLNMQSKLFIEQNRLNLQHKSTPPFYYFHPGLEFTGGNIWWSRILRALLNAGLLREELAQKLTIIQYFPYHSKEYTDLGAILPSQRYSFELVRKVIADGKPIVMMRSEALWLRAVPELADYPYFKLRNPRNPAISSANLGQENFDKLLADYDRALTRERFTWHQGEFEVLDTDNA